MFGRKKKKGKKGTELGAVNTWTGEQRRQDATKLRAQEQEAKEQLRAQEQEAKEQRDPLDKTGRRKEGWVVAPRGTGPYYEYGTNWRAMNEDGGSGRMAYFNPKIYVAELQKLGLPPAKDLASVEKLTKQELKLEEEARTAATVPLTQALRDRAEHGMQQRRRGHARRLELGLYGPELVHVTARVRRAANAKKQEAGGRRRAVHGRRTRRRVRRRRKRRTRRHRTHRRRRSRRRRRKQRRTRHRRRKS